jgi:plastocyanin
MIVNLPAGEQTIYCSQIGHRQMGMTGTIIAK